MRLIGWLLTIGFGLAGLAFHVQGGFAFADQVGVGLLALAALACPVLWAEVNGLLGKAGVPGKDRLMLGLALIIATPLLLPAFFWMLWLPA